jgi:hypothetical protein
LPRAESRGALDESGAKTDPKVDAGGPLSGTMGPGDKVGVDSPGVEDYSAPDTSRANANPEIDAGGPNCGTGVPESGPGACAEDACGSVVTGDWIPGAAPMISECGPPDVALGAVGTCPGDAAYSTPGTDFIGVIAWEFLGCICTG